MAYTADPAFQGPLVVAVDRSGPSPVILAAGELDLACADQLGDLLRDLALRTTGDLVLDMAWLEFMDASGVRVIATTRGELRHAGRRLILANLQPGPRRVLDLTSTLLAKTVVDAGPR